MVANTAPGEAAYVLAKGLSTPGAGYGDTVARGQVARQTTIEVLKKIKVRDTIRATMGSPPTITTQVGAFAGYSKNWPSDNTATENWAAVANFYGGFLARSTNRLRPRAATSNPSTATSAAAVTGFDDTTTSCAFWTDDPAPVLYVNTSNTLPFRFKINGLYASLSGTVAAATSDSYMKIDLSGVDLPAHIEVEGPNSWGLQRIITRPTYSVWAPINDSPRMVVLGDSYVVGPLSTQYSTPTPINQDGWVRAMAEYLQCPDIWASGLGGTGWYQNSGTKPALKDRGYDALNLMPDGLTTRSSWAPELIIATAGINDVTAGISTTNVSDAVQTFYDYIRARNEYVPIMFGGVHWRPTGNLSNTQAMEAAIRAKVEALQIDDSYVGFIPISEATTFQWVFGTGYEGATNGSGNSDYLIGGDGTHQSFAGHRQVGLRYALAVQEFCKQLAP